MAGVVIIGGGQAGFQTADSLRQEGFEDPITILGEEPHAPYQRPPLSKAYLLGETDRERLKFRPEAIYADRGIDLRTGVRVEAVDRASKYVGLSGGDRLAYDHLVLATGARVRELPVPGAGLAGVHMLKTLDDVDAIEAGLANVERVCVIGAGFIGLEFAAVARKLGKWVTVLEAAPRVMGRVAAPVLSDFFTDLHRTHGVEIICGAQVTELRGEGGQVAAVACTDGRIVEAGLVVIGIGVVPNVELAEAAGLQCDNGIVVDRFCRTSDPEIYAAGDCASFEHPFAGRRIRLESVQNAADQGRIAAAAIAGHPRPYDSLPWFWSDQYDVKLQMAGLLDGCDETVVRGDPASGKFSLLHFRHGQFRAVDAISKPADYVQGRKLLEAGLSPTPEQVRDTAFKLKDLLG